MNESQISLQAIAARERGDVLTQNPYPENSWEAGVWSQQWFEAGIPDTTTKEVLIALLLEARKHINNKPWEEETMLHRRISMALGLPVSYVSYGPSPQELKRGKQEPN